VTRVECDVERKMMLNKEMLVKENRGWARSELEALASPIQPWYARNMNKIRCDLMKKIFYESIDSFNFSKICSADKIFCICLLFDY